jgi:CDP-diglyceride synthetase
MYLYTIISAGLLGLGVVLAPDYVISMMGWPLQEPVIFGVFGSVYVAFGFVSILGLRSPLKFSPVLLLQLSYKIVWFAGVALPLVLKGQFPAHGYVFVAIFLSYVIGDLIAIPFGYLFGKSQDEISVAVDRKLQSTGSR